MVRWPFRRRLTYVDPQAAYEIWAPSYPPTPHNRLMEVEQQAILALLPDVTGLRVLDAGCGSGRYLREMTSRGANAIGVDLSSAMLDRARLATCRLIRADLRALPIEAGAIDVAVCALALGDVAELELSLAELARVLRPGGHVVYSVVHPAGEAEGWMRTFESDGRRWAVDGYWHTVDRHRQACHAAGLTIEAWQEPEIDETPGRRAVLVVRAKR